MSMDRITRTPAAAEPGAEGADVERNPGRRPHDGQVLSARRRLLGGVVAAPAVAALYSGSALAATSANCVDKQLRNPQRLLDVTSSVDNWIRVELYALKPSANGAIKGWYIRGLDVDAATGSSPSVGNLFLGPAQYLQYDPVNNTKIGDPITGQPTLSGSNSVFVPGGKYVALRVDSLGGNIDILGVADGTQEGTAVSGTCWTSVAPQ
jgi:hypothetical protein